MRSTKSLLAQTAGFAVCGFSVILGNEPRTADTAVATSKMHERSGNVYENKEYGQNVA